MSLLLVIFTIFSLAYSKKRSKKWFKGRHSEFALPIGICLEKERIHNGIGPIRSTSFRLMCEEEDGDDGDRKVVAYHYREEECNGEIAYTDEYTTADKREFPFNCYEEEELDGQVINPADYAQNWMEVKLTRGKMSTIENVNDTNTTEVCTTDESVNFFRKFQTITNKCVLAKKGGKYYWYYAACTMEDGEGTESAVYLERWDGFNCTGNQTKGYPIYKPDGCEVRWNDRYWHTEVVTCTHPDYSIGAGYRNTDNHIIAVVVLFVMTVYNLQ